MADVDHQHRGTSGLVLCFVDLEVFFFEGELIDPISPERIGQRGGQIDVCGLVAKRELLCFPLPLRPFPRLRSLMSTSRGTLFQRGENLFERIAPDPLYTFGRQRENVVDLFNQSQLAQFVDKLVERQILIEQSMLLCEFAKPFERLLHIATRLDNQVIEQRHHLLEPLLVRRRTFLPLRVKEMHVSLFSPFSLFGPFNLYRLDGLYRLYRLCFSLPQTLSPDLRRCFRRDPCRR